MNTDTDTAERCSAMLWCAEHERSPSGLMTEAVPGLDQPGAYAIQLCTFRRRGAALAGFKLGGTVRPAPGVDRRSYGLLSEAHRLARSGEAVETSCFLRPRAEPEIALRLGRELRGGGHSREGVAAHLDAVIPAIEIADTRYADFPASLVDNIADNSSSGGFVLGTPVAWEQGMDLRSVEVGFFVDDALHGSGSGADVMGDPLLALAWLAERLAVDGLAVPAGAIVMTGGITASVAVLAGQHYRASFSGIGELLLHVA